MTLDLESFLTKIDLHTLVERAGATLNRKRGGTEHRCACPLHAGDNNVAFAIWEVGDQQIWRCYTRCKEGGDAIRFYEKWKNVDFITAVKDLSDMFNLDLKDFGWGKQTPEQKAKLQKARKKGDLLTAASEYYHRQLLKDDNAHAMAYLRGRGFLEADWAQSNWGYSDSGTGLRDWLAAEGYDLALAREMKLIRGDGLDFTANAYGREVAPHGWIIMPHAYGARTSYLSSRAVEIPNQPRKDPKDKSRNIPGKKQLYWAQAKSDDLIVVEGQADAETLRKLGYSALAMCGLTGLPEYEYKRVERFETVYIAVDGDDAGMAELERVESNVVKMCNALGPLTRIVAMLEKKDFNDLLRDANPQDDYKVLKAELRGYLVNANPWLDVRMGQVLNNPPGAQRNKRMDEIALLLSKLHENTRMTYLKKAAEAMEITVSEVRKLIARVHGASASMAEVRHGCMAWGNETVAGFEARITHQLTMDDGENPPICHYTIAGKLPDGRPLEALEVGAEDFGSLKWVPRHWGAKAVIYTSPSNGYKLARCIQEYSLKKEIVDERVYTYTGWTTIDGQRAYLTPAGALTKDGLDESVRVELGQKNIKRYALPEPPTGQDRIDAIKKSLDFMNLTDSTVTAAIWCAMYAAPLSELRSLNAMLWVWGGTQSGKSTLTHLALTHFGKTFINAREYHAPADFLFTPNETEQLMFKAKDIPFVVDDFAPQFADVRESRRIQQTAHRLARSVGNRSGRGRMTEQKTRWPRSLVLATAEAPLVGQSIVGRLLYIPMKRGQLFNRGTTDLSEAQKCAENGCYAAAMSAYIQWLAINWERASKLYLETLEESSRYARLQGELQNRLPDYYAVLDAAQTVAFTAFVEMGAVTVQEANILMMENQQAMIMLVKSQSQQIAEQSPIRKLMQALDSMIARDEIYFSPRRTVPGFAPPDHADKVGWYETNSDPRLYFDLEACLVQAKAYWKSLDQNLDVNPDALAKDLGQLGLLLETDDNRLTKQIRIEGGKRVRVYVIDAGAVAEKYGFTLGWKMIEVEGME